MLSQRRWASTPFDAGISRGLQETVDCALPNAARYTGCLWGAQRVSRNA